MNIFNKTNAPCLAIGALATLTFLASGVFAAAPYIGFLAPVAALSVGLPFIIGGAIISAVAIALSAVVISKNNAISEKSTEIFSLKKQLAKKEKAIEAKNKIIVNPNKDDELKRQHRKEKQEEVLDCADLRNLFDENSEKSTEISSTKSQPPKEENGQGWGAWGLDKAKTAAKSVIGGAIFAAAAAPTFVGTLFTGSSASPAGDMFNSITVRALVTSDLT